eukprot:scaffold297803_cov31-Tisochrysis_lutea.AAC.3
MPTLANGSTTATGRSFAARIWDGFANPSYPSLRTNPRTKSALNSPSPLAFAFCPYPDSQKPSHACSHASHGGGGMGGGNTVPR